MYSRHTSDVCIKTGTVAGSAKSLKGSGPRLRLLDGGNSTTPTWERPMRCQLFISIDLDKMEVHTRTTHHLPYPLSPPPPSPSPSPSSSSSQMKWHTEVDELKVSSIRY